MINVHELCVLAKEAAKDKEWLKKIALEFLKCKKFQEQLEKDVRVTRADLNREFEI